MADTSITNSNTTQHNPFSDYTENTSSNWNSVNHSTLSTPDKTTEQNLRSLDTPLSRFMSSNEGGQQSTIETGKVPLSLPPGTVLTVQSASSGASVWGDVTQNIGSGEIAKQLPKLSTGAVVAVGTAITLGTYSTSLGGYSTYNIDGRNDLRVKFDGDTGSTIIERQDLTTGQWQSTVDAAYRDYASEQAGEMKFVIEGDEHSVLTGRPLGQPIKEDLKTSTPIPNSKEHLINMPSFPKGGENTDISNIYIPADQIDTTYTNPVNLPEVLSDKSTIMVQESGDDKEQGIGAQLHSSDTVQEEYGTLEAAVGRVNPLNEVEYESKTKDPGLSAQGYTEKWTGIDSNGVYHSAFRNPKTGKWTGGHESSKNNKYW
ncbi:MAG: hypothetical protein ABW170_15095 [Candidatus Thiodiazotropha sp. L084R]